MIGPHLTYRLPPSQLDLTELEAAVPGAMVYGWLQRGDRSRKVRLGKLRMDEQAQVRTVTIDVPVHGAWLIEAALIQRGLGWHSAETHECDGIAPMVWPADEDGRDRLEAEGRRSIDALVARGWALPHVADIITPYQARGVAWAETRPWTFLCYACGAGKTLAALMAALASSARDDVILVVCPAKARHVWWSQVQEYSTLEPYRLRPESDMRKSDSSLGEWLDYQRTLHPDKPRLVIAGAEALPDNLDVLTRLAPTILIWDELHIHGATRRWKAVQLADGDVRFEKRKPTGTSTRHTRAVAAMDLSRLHSLRKRLGLSATPLEDGRPRRLWAPFDLLTPGGFSNSYRNYATRHCNARAGAYGGLDDSGSSNLDELRARCSFFMHEVSYSESHAALPSTRVQVTYLGRTELNRADRYSDEQTYTQALRALAREDMRCRLGRTQMIEARLAEACSRKRRWVTAEAIEGLRGGGKVVVFTARRREAEAWADAILRESLRGDEQMAMTPRVWMVHGGLTETDKDRITDAYASDPGPCCLVATGQSVGTGVDGMQTTDLAIFAMLPYRPGDWTQWKGRFDRLGGSATLLKVPVAEGTYDTRVVEILTTKFGPIQQMLAADELVGLDRQLLGLEDTEAVVDSILDKLLEVA